MSASILVKHLTKHHQIPKDVECEKEKLPWVAIRMCLTCGHVGCCDSSVGLHATKHFKETGHPVMVAVPDKSWRWCYIHKDYY